ncbi:MAG: paraquat-inducible protein A [Flavobacteriales bacterium]|nr:paraquat-inducible protein A [Flavobacteriales bacterium]
MKLITENRLRNAIAVVLLIIIALSITQLYRIAQQSQVMKQEKVELQHIKYGLFNVDEWKSIAANIISQKVNNFEITPENEKELQKKTEKILREVIDQAEYLMKEENKKEGIKGFFRQTVSDFVVPFDKLRAQIPQFSKTILNTLNDPKSKEKIKELIIQKINELADETIGSMDYSLQNAIFKKYNVETRAEAIYQLEKQLQHQHKQAKTISILLFISILCAFTLCIIPGSTSMELGVYTAIACVLLLGGVALPMIDIEATISSFEFILMGEQVLFQDQIIFFQSKSILDVVFLLIEKGDPALALVALLIGLFSIIFPLIKIILSADVQIRGYLPKNSFTKFFVFKSGKWSMADVMVVALFMAYLGFGGIINSQLNQLEKSSGSLEVFTTNNSKLQLGFFIFFSFTILSLLISQKIDKRQSINHLREQE